MVLRGHAHPALGDFTVAFWAVAAISLTATIWNRRFSHEAGTEISGHTPRTLQGPAGAPEELTFGELANDQFHRPLRHLRDR
jgi:hypothetical protein